MTNAQQAWYILSYPGTDTLRYSSTTVIHKDFYRDDC